jgi:hypothetical protein
MLKAIEKVKYCQIISFENNEHHLKTAFNLTRKDTIGSLTLPRISSTSAITASPTAKRDCKEEALLKEIDESLLGAKALTSVTTNRVNKIHNLCIIALFVFIRDKERLQRLQNLVA